MKSSGAVSLNNPYRSESSEAALEDFELDGWVLEEAVFEEAVFEDAESDNGVCEASSSLDGDGLELVSVSVRLVFF